MDDPITPAQPEAPASFNLTPQPQNPTTPPAQADPLNTGNGVVAAEPAPTPAPEPVATIENPPLAATTQPVEAEVAAPQPPVTTYEPTPAPEEGGKGKLYIILAIALVVLATGGYFAYTYFFANGSDVTVETEDTDEEATPSTELQELDDIVNDLKNVFEEESASEDAPSGPPSLVIDLSDMESTEAEPAAETEAEAEAEIESETELEAEPASEEPEPAPTKILR